MGRLIGRDLRHSNILGFIGAGTIPGKSFIITEYLEKGGLDRVLGNPSITLPFITRVRMALDTAR
jgi:serine/threonine protein kinase